MGKINVLKMHTRQKLEAEGYPANAAGIEKLLQQIIVKEKKTTLDAARLLGCSRSNVVYWLKRFNLVNSRGRGGANNPYGRRGKTVGVEETDVREAEV